MFLKPTKIFKISVVLLPHIIFYNDSIIETSELCVPHKHLHERMFVLTPLHNIAPEMIHPKYNKTIEELLKMCKDTELVKEYEL